MNFYKHLVYYILMWKKIKQLIKLSSVVTGENRHIEEVSIENINFRGIGLEKIGYLKMLPYV